MLVILTGLLGHPKPSGPAVTQYHKLFICNIKKFISWGYRGRSQKLRDPHPTRASGHVLTPQMAGKGERKIDRGVVHTENSIHPLGDPGALSTPCCLRLFHQGLSLQHTNVEGCIQATATTHDVNCKTVIPQGGLYENIF